MVRVRFLRQLFRRFIVPGNSWGILRSICHTRKLELLCWVSDVGCINWLVTWCMPLIDASDWWYMPNLMTWKTELGITIVIISR